MYSLFFLTDLSYVSQHVHTSIYMHGLHTSVLLFFLALRASSLFNSIYIWGALITPRVLNKISSIKHTHLWVRRSHITKLKTVLERNTKFLAYGAITLLGCISHLSFSFPYYIKFYKAMPLETTDEMAVCG